MTDRLTLLGGGGEQSSVIDRHSAASAHSGAVLGVLLFSENMSACTCKFTLSLSSCSCSRSAYVALVGCPSEKGGSSLKD